MKSNLAMPCKHFDVYTIRRKVKVVQAPRYEYVLWEWRYISMYNLGTRWKEVVSFEVSGQLHS